MQINQKQRYSKPLINKTPGPDGFPVKYYKAFSKKLLTPLANMIKEALENKKLPHCFQNWARTNRNVTHTDPSAS